MVWYVALIAILNIGLGYAMAVYLGAGRRQNHAAGAAPKSDSDDEFADTDDYNSDDVYAESEDLEYEEAGVG